MKYLHLVLGLEIQRYIYSTPHIIKAFTIFWSFTFYSTMKDFELNAYSHSQNRISYVHLKNIIYLLLLLPSNLTLNSFQIIMDPCIIGLSYTVATRHEYTGCNRRNVRDFGGVFLMLNYTDITQNTYIQSWTVTEIMAGEIWNFDRCYSLIDYQIHIETGRNTWFL